jgi:hypothetical protein
MEDMADSKVKCNVQEAETGCCEAAIFGYPLPAPVSRVRRG